MINPSLLELVAKERQRDLLSHTPVRPRDVARSPAIRERLGWVLVELGARLVLDVSAGRSAVHAATTCSTCLSRRRATESWGTSAKPQI